MKYTWDVYFNKIFTATGETLYMVVVATLVACLIGIPLGITAYVTSKNGVKRNGFINIVCEFIVNIGRSIPFIILLILLLPVTRWIVGTTLGTSAAIVPLTIAAIPFAARVTDSSLRELDWGLIEASRSMGANWWQIVWKVLVPESLPGLIRGICLTFINLVGYSAMAGTVGGGGLGNLAYQDGFINYDFTMILLCVVVLIVIVQLVQLLFNLLVKVIDKKNV